MALFERKTFTSHAGLSLDWKINCDFLSDEDWETLASVLAEEYDNYTIVGIPTGGIRLARLLSEKQENKFPNSGVLIVDDVLTTGTSMFQQRKYLLDVEGYEEERIFGLVVFSRMNAWKLHMDYPWITAILQLDGLFAE